MDDNKINEAWMPPQVLARWCKLFPNVSARPSEFYDLLEKALERQKIPKLEVARIRHWEGSIFSERREYLRVSYEHVVFDVCAAPFGTGFFISWWFTEIPLLNLLLALLGLFIFGLFWAIFVHIFGPQLGTALVALGVAFLAWHMREAIANFLSDLDMRIMRIPWVGKIYRSFFRWFSYYRIDVTQMYFEAVSGTIMQAVDEFTVAQGVKPLTESERKPVLKHLYRQAL